MAVNDHSLSLTHASSQYADVSTNLASNVSKLSVMAWVKPTTLSANYAIVTQWPGTPTAWIFRENSASGDLIAYIASVGSGDSAANNGVTATGVISTGSWQHVAFVFDGTQTGNSNRLKIYVNYVQQSLTLNGTIPASIPSITSGRIQIGARDDSTDYFDGLIDEVRIENDAFSSAQIQQYATSNAVLATTIALWNLNNGYTDASANSLTLTSHGSPTFSTDVPFANYTTTNTGGAFLFNFL